MSQMSAATFRVLRARKTKKERMNEISYTGLMLALRNRADREQRELQGAIRRNDRLNERFQSLNDELDRMGNVLQPSECGEGTHRRPANTDGERETPRRPGHDVRPAKGDDEGMEHEIRATCPGYKRDERSHGNGYGCRPRQAISTGWDGY